MHHIIDLWEKTSSRHHFYKLISISLILMFTLTLVCPKRQTWAAPSEVANSQDVTIGVLSFTSKDDTLKKWNPLAKYLTESIPNRKFQITPLFYTEFESVISSKSIDYILTNPAHYIAIGQDFELSGAIATLTELSDGKPQYGFGGVIFTKNENSAPESLTDLVGKKISAVSQSSLGGYQASAFELQKAGLRLESSVEIVLTGMPHSNAVDMVMNEKADAGFVRTGVIEALIGSGELKADDLRILNPQTFKDFDQYISTDMYPEWPFIALSHIEQRDARRVAAALFLMDEHPDIVEEIGISGFTIPSSYLQVELLMRSLKIAPFDHIEPITLYGIWDQYYFELLITIGLLLTISYYAVYKARMGKVLSSKNDELNKATLQLKKMNEDLTQISIKDALTGLYNRRHFEVFFADKLNQIKRHNNDLAICVIDIDNFKFYNDTYGHHIGDAVLVKVANTLKGQVHRSLDLVARYAGDEFIIVLYDVNFKSLDMMAGRIIKAIEDIQLEAPNGDLLTVSISMGVTTASGNCKTTSEELFKSADKALFDAKDKGKNGYVIDYCDCEYCDH